MDLGNLHMFPPSCVYFLAHVAVKTLCRFKWPTFNLWCGVWSKPRTFYQGGVWSM